MYYESSMTQNESTHKCHESDRRAQAALDQHQYEIDDIALGFEKLSPDDYDDEDDEDNGKTYEKMDLLKEHREKYRNYLKQYKLDEQNEKKTYKNLLKEIQDKPIYCVKYNHTLEGQVMNHYQFDAKLQMS